MRRRELVGCVVGGLLGIAAAWGVALGIDATATEAVVLGAGLGFIGTFLGLAASL